MKLYIKYEFLLIISGILLLVKVFIESNKENNFKNIWINKISEFIVLIGPR